MLLYNAQEPTDFESYQKQGDVGFTNVAGAQIDTFIYEDLSNSRERNLDAELWKEVYKVHDLAPEMFGPKSVPQTNPNAPKILQQAWNDTAQAQNAARLSDWESMIEPNLEALKSRFPESNIRNRDEIDTDIAAQAKVMRDKFEKTYSYADPYAAFFGTLGGAAVASMADPINIMTLPLGGGKVAGASFIKGLGIVVARNFGIGVVTEAALQPFVYDYKKEIESPYDLQDALFNMAAAGLGNGLLNGLGHGIARGFDKIVGKQELPDTHETRRLRKDIQALLELQTFADETGAKTVGELEVHLKALNTAMADIEAGRQVDYDSLGKTIEAEYLELFDVEVNGARATMDYIAQKRYELEESFDPDLYAKQEQLQKFADQKLTKWELKQAQNKADIETTGELNQETDLDAIREIQKADFDRSVGEDTIRQNEEANIANNDLRASRRDEGDMIALKQQMDDLDNKYSEQVDYHSAAKKARDQYVVDRAEETNQAIAVAPTDTPRMMAVKTAVNRIALLLGGQNIKVKVYEGNPDVDGNMRYAREAIDPSYKNTIIGKVYDSISDFAKAASKGKVNKAREFDLDQRDILDGVMPATEFDFSKVNDDGIGMDYEMGTFNKKLEDAGLYVIDNSYGKVIAGKTKEDALNLQNARTPIEYGKSYGYSDDDIAAFYLKRAGGIEELAYSEYQSDLNVSSKFDDVRYSKDGQTIEAAINPETGELHINASAFRDEAHLMEVMREEIIGHYGLRKSLGGDFQGVINDIKSTALTNPELRQMWVDLSGIDPQTRQIINPNAPYKGMADDVIADEIISKMARKEIGDTTFMTLKNIIIKALRKIGLVKDDITISEMRALVIKSEQALKKNVVKKPTITGMKPQLKQIDEPLNNEAIDAEAARIVSDETTDQVIFDQNGNTINLRDALMEDDNDIAGIESIRVCML